LSLINGSATSKRPCFSSRRFSMNMLMMIFASMFVPN
jgi:hypothetical protein